MLTFIFILGLLIILSPFLGGVIATISGWIIIGVSLPFYWLMRIFKHPANAAEDEKLTKISTGISMILIVAALIHEIFRFWKPW